MSKQDGRYVQLDEPIVRMFEGISLVRECPICGAEEGQCCSMPDGYKYSAYVHEKRVAE